MADTAPTKAPEAPVAPAAPAVAPVAPAVAPVAPVADAPAAAPADDATSLLKEALPQLHHSIVAAGLAERIEKFLAPAPKA